MPKTNNHFLATYSNQDWKTVEMGRIPIALCVIGTRPEAIKMAPVVQRLMEKGFHVPVLSTAQHRHLLDQVLDAFQLKATWDLDAMRPNQGLSELLGRILPSIEAKIIDCGANVVLAQGDTTTVLGTALAAFHAKVPFCHVEAGLRSGNLAAPFPEEGNRRLAGVVTRYHFAPTDGARAALMNEGIGSDSIKVVGNTVIDALLEVAGRENLPWPSEVPFVEGERRVLVTLHRRENFGRPFESIFRSLRAFAEGRPDCRLIYPIHPNPNVKGLAEAHLGGMPNVHLIEPQPYPTLVNLLRNSYAVFTDSGGIQEEAPALGIPVLVFRDVTERPEVVVAGGAILVGSDPDCFCTSADQMFTDRQFYEGMAQRRFPYGDGRAAERIADILAGVFMRNE